MLRSWLVRGILRALLSVAPFETCCADRTNPVRSSCMMRKITSAVGFVRHAREIHARYSILLSGNFTVDGGEKRSIESKRELRRRDGEISAKLAVRVVRAKVLRWRNVVRRAPLCVDVRMRVVRVRSEGCYRWGAGEQKVKRSMRTR